MINEVALVLLLGMFGWKIVLIYIISGLLIAIFSGMLIEKMDVRNLVEEFARNGVGKNLNLPELSKRERMQYAKTYTLNIVKKVWLYVMIGVGVGAWIHGYVPATALAQYASGDN